MLTNLSRASLYLLLSSLEEDLRDIAEKCLSALKAADIFDKVTFEKVEERIRKNVDGEPPIFSLKQCLRYSDLGDCVQILYRNSSKLPEGIQKHIQSVLGKIEKTIPIRNRVMHSRPLEWDDFPSVSELCRLLVSNQTDLWSTVRQSLRLLKANPEAALRANLVFSDTAKVLHNLPAPDFDDTGFIGRSDKFSELMTALKGPYPVISLTGEGGVGKSALALKACYSVVDEPSKFEAVVWTSAKSNRLTVGEIVAINDAISSSLGIFQAALKEIGANPSENSLHDLIQHLADFPILLVIDNLETVLDDNMRTLARSMPASGSKLIFTTRVGLGALDFPIAIPPLMDKESQHFLRRAAEIWRVNNLLQLNEARAKDYTERLQRNPLFIKWFVQAVRSGITPEKLLSNPKIILEFCLQNVFEKLRPEQKNIIDAIVSTKPPYSLSVLSYYTDLSFDALEENVSILLGSNILSQRLEKDGSFSFMLSDLARLYVRNYLRPSPADQKKYESKERALTSLAEGYLSTTRNDQYDEYTIAIRSRADIPASQILRDALKESAHGNVAGAIKLIDRARSMNPDYFEVFRVGALIYSWHHDFIAAEDMFEKAMALSSQHPPLYYFFGSFLLRQKNEAEQARKTFLDGLKLDSKSVPLRRSLAQAELFAGRYDDVRKILDEMNDVIELLPERQRRILVDVYLQSYAREMDREAELGNYQRSLAALRGLRKYWDYQFGWIDELARERLAKRGGRLEQVALALKFSPEANEAVQLADWFHENIRSPKGLQATGEKRSFGRVESIIDNFGFLVVDGRIDKLFFHKGSFSDNAVFSDLKIGDRVSFLIGENYKGTMATQVLIEN